MKRLLNTTVCSLVAMSMATQAFAQDADAPAKPPTAKELGSVYVRCDGQPAGLSGAELAGMLFLITATGGVVGGLVGAPETADDGKKNKGAEGVAACTAAIAQEKEEVRLMRLTLARAVHQIEAKDYDAALADVRSISAITPEKSQDRWFKRSADLSAMELEAAIMVRTGRNAEAEAIALRMAAMAPYDILTLYRSVRFVGLTAEMTPEKKAFFESYVRVSPLSLLTRAEARQWAGDYAGSAADLEALNAAADIFLKEKQPEPPLYAARRSVAYQLAGDNERSNAIAAEARAAVDALVKSGKALNEANTVSQAEELLDFQAIGRQLAEGKVKEARTAFAARTRWLAASPPAVALMTSRLRAGAAPQELTGSLARDPEQLRADGLAAKAGAIIENPKAEQILYGAIRPVGRKADYTPYTRTVWRTDKSRYVLKRSPKANHVGEVVFIYGAYNAAGGEALLLHCALVASARGKDGFLIYPGRSKFDSAIVIFANRGDPGVPESALLDADTVIEALSVDMPKPVKGG